VKYEIQSDDCWNIMWWDDEEKSLNVTLDGTTDKGLCIRISPGLKLDHKKLVEVHGAAIFAQWGLSNWALNKEWKLYYWKLRPRGKLGCHALVHSCLHCAWEAVKGDLGEPLEEKDPPEETNHLLRTGLHRHYDEMAKNYEGLQSRIDQYIGDAQALREDLLAAQMKADRLERFVEDSDLRGAYRQWLKAHGQPVPYEKAPEHRVVRGISRKVDVGWDPEGGD